MNILNKCMVTTFAVLFFGALMASVFSSKTSAQKIDAIGMSENEESFLCDESYSKYDLKDNSDYCEEELENTECTDKGDSGVEFIKRIRNPEFKKWCESNIELIKSENMNKRKAYDKFRYITNKAQISEYRKANEDKISEYQTEYRKANKDKISKYQTEYRKANKDKISEKRKEYYKTNKQRINARRRELWQKAKAEANAAVAEIMYKETN